MITPLEWLSCLALSWALFGLILTIQLVHYPTFRYVSDFTNFHSHHTSSISLIVAPLMVAELIVTGWLAYKTAFDWRFMAPLVLVLLIWGLTFLRAIPLHETLSLNRDGATIEALILINWPRTLLWTGKAMWISALFLIRGPVN